MDTERLTTIDKILLALEKKKNFVLQGGAGSGKTQSLKDVIDKVSKEYDTKKIACITYTNRATDEIIKRVGNDFTICTIHSFLYQVIINYKKNIHQVIEELFLIPKIERKDISIYEDGKDQATQEHKKYKKIYEKYNKIFWTLNKKSSNEKPKGKKEYDSNFESFNDELNTKIDFLNNEIKQYIKEKIYNEGRYNSYNETRFNNLKDLTFGHDGLLEISVLLFKKFPLLTRIVQDKFDFIFIDEYQDTNSEIVDIFIKKIGVNPEKTQIGLFGDSMQAIYKEGVGDVEQYISDKNLELINKEDNYRCSKQVIEFANQFRNDGLEQKVALKEKEIISIREGCVTLYYSIYEGSKPNQYSSSDEKDKYIQKLSNLIQNAEEKNRDIKYVKLMLTNKSIASELNFTELYDLFSLRTQEINELIEKEFNQLQINDLAQLCIDYKQKRYNSVLTKINKAGFKLIVNEDKKKISDFFNRLLFDDIDCITAIEEAFENSFIKKSASFEYYLKKKKEFFENIYKDDEYKEFKKKYNEGRNTAIRMKIDQKIFDSFFRKFQKENFYLNLFENKEIPFKEVLNYQEYIDKEIESEYITMHKTKGGEIENIIVVLDKYFWTEYDFEVIFEDEESEKKLKNRKLFYVACSRAKKNLICVKLINENEEENLIKYFTDYKKIIL